MLRRALELQRAEEASAAMLAAPGLHATPGGGVSSATPSGKRERPGPMHCACMVPRCGCTLQPPAAPATAPMTAGADAARAQERQDGRPNARTRRSAARLLDYQQRKRYAQLADCKLRQALTVSR